MSRQRTIAAIGGAGLAIVLGVTFAVGAATADPRGAEKSESAAAPAASATPAPVVELTASSEPPVSESGGTAAASVALIPGPQELAMTACMADQGFVWSYAIGVAIADAELAAVESSAAAGYELRSPETSTAEQAAAAAAAGVDVEAYPAFRVALTGDFANDPTGCAAQATTVEDTTAVDGSFGKDWENHQAISRSCLSARGFDVTAEDDDRMQDAVDAANLDWNSDNALAQADAIRAGVMGWTVERLHEYAVAQWGDTGAGTEYRWEEAGCAGYATHATGNDHNN